MDREDGAESVGGRADGNGVEGGEEGSGGARPAGLGGGGGRGGLGGGRKRPRERERECFVCLLRWEGGLGRHDIRLVGPKCLPDDDS